MANTVEFAGEQFTPMHPGHYALHDLAAAMTTGSASNPQDVLLITEIAEHCVADDEVDRFRAAARRERVSTEGLLELLKAVIEATTDRPTSRPSDSSDGPSTTEASSTDGSSVSVIRRLEQEGRPDLALLVQRSIESKTA